MITAELDPELPPVSAAPVQMQQVLLNLIMNALDAVEGLPLPERRITVTSRSDRGEVAGWWCVTLASAFRRIVRKGSLITSFRRKKKGMGMGLAIVRSIVEAHGGTIIAENAPDRGARLIVRLPAAQSETERKRMAA